MQIELIRALQNLRTPPLTAFFEIITTIGATQFYVFVLPLLFWWVSTTIGYRFIVVVLISAYLNSMLKDLGPLFISNQYLFYTTRPFAAYPEQVWTCRRDPLFDPQAVLARLCREEESFSFPSGHAQTSLVAWGYLLLTVRRRWFSALAVALIVLIGLSRMYLGQHWPTDVLGGWLIGGALLGGAFYLFSLWRLHPRALNLVLLTLLLALVPLLLALDDDPTFNRTRALGLLVGSSSGYLAHIRYAKFVVRAAWSVQILKLAIGALGLGALQFGLGALLPNMHLAELLLTLLIGLWVTLVAPLIFGRIWGVPSPPATVRSADERAPTH
ncbi:MAG TPA: phosphatase PAP2 family protein [Herpetosiphonaceae bacterium]